MILWFFPITRVMNSGGPKNPRMEGWLVVRVLNLTSSNNIAVMIRRALVLVPVN